MFDILKNLPWKKIGIVAGFIAISGTIGFLIYTLFFKPAVTPTPPPGEVTYNQLPGAKPGVQPGVTPVTPPAGGLPPSKTIKVAPAEIAAVPDSIANGGVTKVTELDYNNNQSISISPSGNTLRSYDAGTGQFFNIDADGNRVPLSSKTFKNVQNIGWSPKQDQAILEFPDGSNVFYDFNTDKQISLPKDWTGFSFNAEGSGIAFKDMNANPDLRWLAVANPDGSGSKYLEQLGDNAKNFKVDWSPNGKMVAQFIDGGNAQSSKLFFVGTNGENFRSITIPGNGVETKWTPDGNRLLYSSFSKATDNKPELSIVDASGDNVGYNNNDLKLNTWPDKCAFAGTDTLYCGVPKDLPANADLVPSIADTIPDYIYKVDLTTGAKSFVAEPEFNYTVDAMAVSEDGSSLFFTDKLTGNLHTIKLK